MSFRLQPLAVAVAAAVLFTPLAQGDHESDKVSKINDILVTVPENETTPGGSLLNKEDFQTKRAATSDSAALLRGLPGVSLYGAGGVSSLPSIRGLADDRLRIKVDGMDLVSSCGNHMNPPLSYIDPSAVDKIQVFAGVAPVSLGGDSIGGTIVIESADPKFAANPQAPLTEAEIGAFYRSNGDGQGANASATAANTWLSLRYSGAFAKADNYKAGDAFKAAGPAAPGRDWLASDEVGSSAYESQNHKLGLAARNDNHLFDLELGYQHIPHQGFPNQRMDMTDNTSKQLSLRHQGEYRWGAVESRIYREETSHKMNFAADKQFWYMDAPGMPMETEGENSGLTVKATYNLSKTDLLRAGAEIQQYRLDDWWPPSGSGMMMGPNTFWNIRDGKRDRYALFGEWQSDWNTQWQTLVGLRHETVKSNADDVHGYSMMYAADAAAFNAKGHNKTDDNWDFSAQTSFTPDASQRYDLAIARKTRSANLYERYTWSTLGMAMRMVNLAGDGNGYVGNLELEPEIAHTLSFTADWHDPKSAHWQWLVTPFYILVDDYIDAAPCTAMMCNAANAMPGFRYLSFRNDDARLYGLDMSAYRHLASSQTLGNLSAKLIASYVDGENQRTGDNLYNIMPLNATLTLEQTQGRWLNSVEWQLVSAKDEVSATRNEVGTTGYGLLNLRTSYTIDKLRIDGGVENLLDRDHDLPLGGAYVGQGATMGTAVPWGVAVPGPGRSIYAGVTYSF